MSEKIQEQNRIRDAINNIDLYQADIISLEHYCYRANSYRYSNKPLSTLGAEKTGGRYNFKSRDENKLSFPCLYCSETDFTSITEKFHEAKYNGEPLPPFTVVCFKANLTKVLDISSNIKCKKAGVDWEEINQPQTSYVINTTEFVIL